MVKASNILQGVGTGMAVTSGVLDATGIGVLGGVPLGVLGGVTAGVGTLIGLFGGSMLKSELSKIKRIHNRMKRHESKGGSLSSLNGVKKAGVSIADLGFIKRISDKYQGAGVISGGSISTGGALTSREKRLAGRNTKKKKLLSKKTKLLSGESKAGKVKRRNERKMKKELKKQEKIFQKELKKQDKLFKKEKKLKKVKVKVKVKRQPNKWIRALKKYNQGKPTYCVPKKGSSAYKEVRKIQLSL
jgi:hypothetical protein